MQFEITQEFVDNLQEIIARKDEAGANQVLSMMHAADIAEIYDELSIDEAKYLYFLLDKEKAGDVLIELEEDERKRFLDALPGELIANQFIDEMDSDDAADILGELSESKKQEVLAHINDLEQAGDIVDLLNYEIDTAGGLMAKEYIAVSENIAVNECISEIRRQAEHVDEIYNVYVVADEGVLVGTLSLKKLLIAPSSMKVGSICNHDVHYVKTDTDSEEVANIMNKYDLISLPVIDGIGRLVGKITIDDVVDVIKEEAEKDYQMASGISEDVETSDNVWILTRARLPWLMIGLLGGILGAMVIGNYESDLGLYPEMAFFIPLIAAMGGNVGVQSSAIIVQGLAGNSLGLETTGRKLLKEFFVALLNGAACSGLMLLYNIIVSDELALTLTVSTALYMVIIFASLFGTIVPLVLDRFKIDPALATGPFITTVNDIIGLIIYLSIGRLLYGVL